MEYLKNILRKKRQLVLWFGSYFIIVLVSVAINMVGYTNAISVMQREVAKVNSGSMKQMQIMYDNYLQDIKNTSYLLINSRETKTLSTLNVEHTREVELLQNLINNIRSCNGSKEWIATTEILFHNKNICVDMGAKYTKELLYQMRYSDFYSSKDAWLNDLFVSELASYKVITDKNGHKRFIYLFTSPVVGKKPIVIATELNIKVMEQYLTKIADANGRNAMIVNKDSDVIFAANKLQDSLNLKLNETIPDFV